MDPKEAEFIGWVDAVSNSCRERRGFIRNWRTKGLEWSIRYAPGFDEKQRQILEHKARELGIF
jgi:hypothetical protein